jgi:hypothetical protein
MNPRTTILQQEARPGPSQPAGQEDFIDECPHLDHYEGLSGTFADACREADREFRKQRAKQKPAIVRERGAAASTAEALMYSLRQRRTAALKEPDTLRRLAQLGEEQFLEVCSRLQKLKPEIARLWSDQEIDQLVIARKK